MTAIFVHLSDIHFGQEKGGQVVINDDAKARLIDDAAAEVAKLAGGRAAGILVTGDIAYSGQKEEYRVAAEFLDALAGAIGCKKTDVQVVPGNHDIDRAEISLAVDWMLGEIKANGEAKLDAFLASDNDREALYRRFNAYRPFAEGYDCPLDGNGGLAGDRSIELAPGRVLRFIGLNSALICAKRDDEGTLLLGARQRVLPKTDGEELVVLAHHPLPWLQDSEDARRYVRARARVFISGHEHDPSVRLDAVREGCDLLMLAAGATVPPHVDDRYNYAYNILEFDWDEPSDALQVTIHPRAWSQEDKEFEDDAGRLGAHLPKFTLGCPNFRSAAKPEIAPLAVEPISGPQQTVIVASPVEDAGEARRMEDRFRLLLLRFFRDLSEGERLAVLVKLGVLPDDWPEPLTHAIERQIVNAIAEQGQLDALQAAIDAEEAGEEGESQ